MEGRLLLVDDDPGVLDLLHEYFAGQGYDVELASSGEAALSAVRAKRPDLVLLDIRMPGIDGVEVLRRLRREDGTLPVVMVTANEDVTLARETLNVGAFDYVAKPFDFTHLEQVVTAGLLHAAPSRNGADGPAEPWAAVATAVFQATRRMTEAARRSTGTRLEDAVLAAARASFGGQSDAARGALGELRLLLKLSVEAGDLPAAGRDAVVAALERVGGGAPAA
jgi:DNA-binding response OmpR family regulator